MAFESIDNKQLWRTIPPEEKFELMARAHSKGMSAAVGLIIVGCTLAVGLQIPSMMWISILLSPIIFQGTASKSWRALKPRAMLEYLGARSAARRFAFALNSNRLNVANLIRARMEEVFEVSEKTSEIEAEFEDRKEKDVWVALFHDALVIISEQAGGAKLELGQLLNKHLVVSGISPSGQGEYAIDREVHLKVTSPMGLERRCKITSQYPAALVVLEKQMIRLMNEAPVAIEEVMAEPASLPLDDFMNFSIS